MKSSILDNSDVSLNYVHRGFDIGVFEKLFISFGEMIGICASLVGLNTWHLAFFLQFLTLKFAYSKIWN